MREHPKDKNDYKLINSLLKDGSDKSLLKLKMIVDMDLFELKKIHKSKRLLLIETLEEQCKNFFINDIENIELLNKKDAFKVLNTYKSEFEKCLEENPGIIYCVSPDKLLRVVKMFKPIYKNYYTHNFIEAIGETPPSKRLEIVKFFKKSCGVVFSHSPNLISYFPEENTIDVLNLFKDSFEQSFFDKPWHINQITQSKIEEVIIMFKDVLKKSYNRDSHPFKYFISPNYSVIVKKILDFK